MSCEKFINSCDERGKAFSFVCAKIYCLGCERNKSDAKKEVATKQNRTKVMETNESQEDHLKGENALHNGKVA